LAPAAIIEPDPDRELRELREYLGDEYDEAKLRRYEQTVVEEFRRIGDELAFYRTSEGYLYDLSAFAASGTKLPYLERLTAAVPAPARVLDYGCGIGSDGLLLLEAGYRVEFADFDNPSVAYLRWRLDRRGLEAPIHDIERGAVPSGFDAAYAFDVVEHVPDPEAFLAELERRAALVAVNLLEEEEDDLPIHHPLPIARLRSRAARGRVVHYGRYHDRRSHLLLYRPPPAGIADRLRSRAAIARGRLLG
jgi:SAM-dependent methyltransferase